MRAFGEFGATVIMTYYPQAFPVYIYTEFQAAALAPLLPLSLLAVVMGALALLVISAIDHFGAFTTFARKFSLTTRAQP